MSDEIDNAALVESFEFKLFNIIVKLSDPILEDDNYDVDKKLKFLDELEELRKEIWNRYRKVNV